MNKLIVGNLTKSLGVSVSVSYKDEDNKDSPYSYFFINFPTPFPILTQDMDGSEVLRGCALTDLGPITRYGIEVAKRILHLPGVNSLYFDGVKEISIMANYSATEKILLLTEVINTILNDLGFDLSKKIAELNSQSTQLHVEIIIENKEESWYQLSSNKEFRYVRKDGIPFYINESERYNESLDENPILVNDLFSIDGISSISLCMRSVIVTLDEDIAFEDVQEKILELLVKNLEGK